MNENLEIERKFLVVKDKLDLSYAAYSSVIRQGYFFSNDRGSIRIRIEKRGEESGAFLMSKRKVDSMTNIETTDIVTIKTAEILFNYFIDADKQIIKTRYRIVHSGNVWEVDVFNSPNPNLILAEIELKSKDQEIEFPEWIGEEVTGIDNYYNANM